MDENVYKMVAINYSVYVQILLLIKRTKLPKSILVISNNTKTNSNEIMPC